MRRLKQIVDIGMMENGGTRAGLPCWLVLWTGLTGLTVLVAAACSDPGDAGTRRAAIRLTVIAAAVIKEVLALSE